MNEITYALIPGDEGGGRTTEGLPYMQKSDIEAMAKEIETRRPKKVLEYGSGASSLYWPQRYKFIELWLAVEHQADWALHVASKQIPGVLVQLAVDNQVESYVHPPKQLAPFDMIIVDGVFRGKCITLSHNWLSTGGVVLLHDADRPEMQQFESVYPHFKRLTCGNTPDDDGFMKRDGLLMMWGDK